jgi:hypothetical protein
MVTPEFTTPTTELLKLWERALVDGLFGLELLEAVVVVFDGQVRVVGPPAGVLVVHCA